MSEKIDLAGKWFEAGTSASTPARLSILNPDGDIASLQIDGCAVRNVKILSVSDRLGAVERRIELEGGHAFFTSDNDKADKLAQFSKGVFSKVAGLERFHPRLMIFLFVAVGLIYAIVTQGLPIVAKVAAWATPPKVVEWMDASTVTTLDRIVFSASKLPQSRRDGLSEAFGDLAKASGYKGRLKLNFRDGGRLGPNALALPAGTLIVTDQLVKLASDDEVLAVLAHEISHVQEEHSLQQFYRALGFAGIIGVIAGDMGAVAEEVLSGGGVLVAMAASREMEFEADAEAVKILKRTDIDPKNLSSLLDKLYAALCKGSEESCEETGWLSTHPGGKERREALRREIEAP